MPVKYLQHLLAVMIKYFFDIDFHLLKDALSFVFICIAVVRLLGHRVGAEFSDSYQTVVDDAVIVRADLLSFGHKLNSAIDAALLPHIENLKNRLPQFARQ